MVDNPLITPSSINDEDLQLIKIQLKRILESKNFKSTKQLKCFLKYVIEKAIAGEDKYIKQYTIGVEALSLGNDFDPNNSPTVRITGGRVRDRLKEYYYKDGRNDELIISIPKGTYIPEFKRNPHKKNKSNTNHEISRGPTLALASFSDATQDTASNRLLFQITDNIATEISRFLILQLVVYNPYADKERSHFIETEMKSTQRADYILALFLQQLSKNKYQLIYRLIFVDTGETLWSESYTVTELPINEQDHIVGEMVSKVTEVQQGILPNHWSRRLLENKQTIPECHQVLAYVRYYIDNLDRSAFAKAVKFCLKALNRNSNDVIANVVYAAYCKEEYVYRYGVIESPLKVGRQCAETAVRLNPNSHEAHFFLAQIMYRQKDWKHSKEEFEIARSITKNNIPIEYCTGFHLCMMNKWEEGLPLVKKAMAISSSNPLYHLIPFFDFYRQGKYTEALYEAKKITVCGLIHGPLTRCIAYTQLGEHIKAKKEFEEILRRYPNFMDTGQKYLQRFLGTDILTERIWDGIIKVTQNSK